MGLLCSFRFAYAENNLLLNGDVTAGLTNKPAYWQSEGWLTGQDITIYNWRHDSDGASLEVTNLKPNDARWVQKVHLMPGWYHLTAVIRAYKVGQLNAGAALALMGDGIISQQLHGTTNWRKVGLFLKVGGYGADVVIACRLGGYGSLNTGAVFCRELRAVREEPGSSDDPKYDLDNINAGSNIPPEHSDNSALVISILALCAAVLVLVVGRRRFKRNRGGSVSPASLPTECAFDKVRQAPKRKIEIVLFLVTALTFAYFYQGSDHSTASRIDLIRAILERHTLWIENPYAGYNTADIVQSHSHIYSNKAPGGAFTGIIPWAVAATILKPFQMPENGFYWALMTYITTVVAISGAVSLLTVLVYRSVLFLGMSNGRAAGAALTLGLATIMFPYATEFTAEPIAALCVFTGFYLVLTADADAVSAARYFWAGLLSGWSVLSDYPTFILATGVAGYFLWKRPRPVSILSFGMGSFIPAFLLAWYNRVAFGNALFLSYEAYMLPGSDRFPEQAVGFAGVTYPRLDILWNILFGAQRGLFFCNPVLLLTIPGLVFLWRSRRQRAEPFMVAYAIVSFVAFNSSYGKSIIYWGGGTATGPRHIVPVLPFMVLTLAFLPKPWNCVYVLMAVLSAFLMLMVTAVEPHLPYEYSNPLRDFIWPAYLRGDFGYNKLTYFGGPPIVGDSVAFNLGKLFGFPGALQLLPLALIWVIAALELLSTLRLWEDFRKRRQWSLVASLIIIVMFAPPAVRELLAKPNLRKPQGLLGRYYEGLYPSHFAPHIVRVDSNIDFSKVEEMGALPPPSCVIWTGRIIISTPGLYRFTIAADDNGWLKIDNRWIIGDAGDKTKLRDEGAVQLASGVYPIEVGERNVWDGAQMKLMWQLPSGGDEQIIPSSVLIPEAYRSGSG